MVSEVGIAITFVGIGVIGLLKNREYWRILRLVSSARRSPISEVFFVMSPVFLYFGIIGLISQYFWWSIVFSAVCGIIGASLGLGGMATLGELDSVRNQTHSTLFSAIFSFWIGGWIIIIASFLTNTIDIKDVVSLLLFTTPIILIVGVNHAVEALKAESRRRNETES